MDDPLNPNPNPEDFTYLDPNFNNLDDNFDMLKDVDLSDFLMPDDRFDEEDSSSSWSTWNSTEKIASSASPPTSVATSNFKSEMKGKKEKKKMKLEQSIMFRMKSTIDVLDDGYKWRKYGKKPIRGTPYPRHYHKCSNEGCSVRKKIERDREDPNYVITTYDGVHNHHIPSVVYCDFHDLPFTSQTSWSLQPSHPPSSSS